VKKLVMPFKSIMMAFKSVMLPPTQTAICFEPDQLRNIKNADNPSGQVARRVIAVVAAYMWERKANPKFSTLLTTSSCRAINSAAGQMSHRTHLLPLCTANLAHNEFTATYADGCSLTR
jgi:hypothetical protein